MRMRQNRIRFFNHRKRIVTKDGEGVPQITYSEPTRLKGEFWPGGGSLQIETYGDRISGILNIRIEDKYTIVGGRPNRYVLKHSGIELVQGDGICIDTVDPDYRITSIKPERYLRIEAERI